MPEVFLPVIEINPPAIEMGEGVIDQAGAKSRLAWSSVDLHPGPFRHSRFDALLSKRRPARELMIDASVVINMLDDPDDLAILEEALCPASAFCRKAVRRYGAEESCMRSSQRRGTGCLDFFTT